MNTKLILLSICSFIISNVYSQQPPAKSLTLEERKERADRAYRVCQRSYHLKCAAYYEEETTETKQVDTEKCEYFRHVTCMKVAQEKFTEGFFEEVKEYFRPQK